MRNEQAGDAFSVRAVKARGYFHIDANGDITLPHYADAHISQQSALERTFLANKITFIFSFGSAELAVKMCPN